jgi:hypothetical protein
VTVKCTRSDTSHSLWGFPFQICTGSFVCGEHLPTLNRAFVQAPDEAITIVLTLITLESLLWLILGQTQLLGLRSAWIQQYYFRYRGQLSVRNQPVCSS